MIRLGITLSWWGPVTYDGHRVEDPHTLCAQEMLGLPWSQITHADRHAMAFRVGMDFHDYVQRRRRNALTGKRPK